MATIPNPAFSEHHVRAWLYTDEVELLDAVECADLSGHVTVSVCLREDRNEYGRKNRRKAKVADRDEREARASKLVSPRAHAMGASGDLLRVLATTRRQLHYARLGVECPALPKED